MNQQYFFTKKLIQRKLGKKEENCIVSSDSELDLKLELFESLKDSCSNLSNIVEALKDRMQDLAQEQNSLGRFLRDVGKNSSTSSGVMTNTGKVICYIGQQHLSMQAPLFRINQEVSTFKSRAIKDSKNTITAMEQNRTQYRAALSAMKSCGGDIDPDTGRGIEKYRQAQQYVRFAKVKFDKYSLACMQKVDLLAAARCNLFSYSLANYTTNWITVCQNNVDVLQSNIKSIEPAKHIFGGVLKDLGEADDRRELKAEKPAKKEKSKSNKDGKKSDHNLFFGDEYTDQPNLNQGKNESTEAKNNDEDTKLIDYEKDLFDELMSTSNVLPSQLLLDDSIFSSNSLDSTAELLNNLSQQPNLLPSDSTPQKAGKEKDEKAQSKKSTKKSVNWLDLFSELDPLAQKTTESDASKNA